MDFFLPADDLLTVQGVQVKDFSCMINTAEPARRTSQAYVFLVPIEPLQNLRGVPLP